VDFFLHLVFSMVGLPKLSAAVILSALALDCAHFASGLHSDRVYVTAAQRLSLIRRAHVWKQTDVRAMDLKAGPQGKGAFAPGATVTCEYVEEAFSGATPKFGCAITPEDRVKVRYGRDNSEVSAGIAATRLLWALGFGADPLYPVHVVCHHCPARLVGDGRTASGDMLFDVAAIERKMPGHDIEAPSVGPGWAWPELDLVDEGAGGAPRAHRDALKLVAVLLQHGDNKPDQQRVFCPSEEHSKRALADCPTPFMMTHDVGMTFGRANLFNRKSVGGANLDEWSHVPVWKGAKRCVGNLAPSQTGTLSDPLISEVGRKFLADLLTELSDDQLRDLFSVAGFGDKPARGGGWGLSVVDAWVAAFKHKRDEIAAVRCS